MGGRNGQEVVLAGTGWVAAFLPAAASQCRAAGQLAPEGFKGFPLDPSYCTISAISDDFTSSGQVRKTVMGEVGRDRPAQ